jgi:general secretion pathway protein G
METRYFRYRSKAAFTLIELLAVIAIIGILAAIIIPVTAKVRGSARNVECVSSLRNLGAGISLYAADHRDTLPVYWTPADNWIYKLSGFNQTNATDYIGICLHPVPGTTKLITANDSNMKSILLCRQNILDSEKRGIGSASASTYAMSSVCSQLRIQTAGQPAQTALMVETTCVDNSWAFTTTAGNRMSVSVHGNHSNALYLDGHVKAVRSIPDASDPFWTP